MTEPLETVTDLSELEIPFMRHLRLQSVDYHNGFNMIRMIWREGKRLTIVNLDADTANDLGERLIMWAKEHSSESES